MRLAASSSVEDLGQLDNTLIIYIAGDNAPSAEGCSTHTERIHLLQCVQVPVKTRCSVPFWDRTERSRTTRGVAWRWTRRSNGEAGGVTLRRTAQGLAMSCPAHQRHGRLPRQFHHVIDIMPTILEAAGIAAPERSMASRSAPSKA